MFINSIPQDERELLNSEGLSPLAKIIIRASGDYLRVMHVYKSLEGAVYITFGSPEGIPAIRTIVKPNGEIVLATLVSISKAFIFLTDCLELITTKAGNAYISKSLSGDSKAAKSFSNKIADVKYTLSRMLGEIITSTRSTRCPSQVHVGLYDATDKEYICRLALGLRTDRLNGTETQVLMSKLYNEYQVYDEKLIVYEQHIAEMYSGDKWIMIDTETGYLIGRIAGGDIARAPSFGAYIEIPSGAFTHYRKGTPLPDELMAKLTMLAVHYNRSTTEIISAPQAFGLIGEDLTFGYKYIPSHAYAGAGITMLTT